MGNFEVWQHCDGFVFWEDLVAFISLGYGTGFDRTLFGVLKVEGVRFEGDDSKENPGMSGLGQDPLLLCRALKVAAEGSSGHQRSKPRTSLTPSHCLHKPRAATQ